MESQRKKEAATFKIYFSQCLLLSLFFLFLLPAAHWPQHRERPFVGAGILPYTGIGGDVYILLGYDPGRGWTSFGGAPEKVVSVADANPRWETRVETALREAFEECRLVIPFEEFERGLRADRFFPESQSRGEFRTFTVKILYRPVSMFAERRVPVNSRYSEKTNYVWMPLDQLRQMVLKGEKKLHGSPGNNKLWDVFYHGLQQLFKAKDYKKHFPL